MDAANADLDIPAQDTARLESLTFTRPLEFRSGQVSCLRCHRFLSNSNHHQAQRQAADRKHDSAQPPGPANQSVEVDRDVEGGGHGFAFGCWAALGRGPLRRRARSAFRASILRDTSSANCFLRSMYSLDCGLGSISSERTISCHSQTRDIRPFMILPNQVRLLEHADSGTHRPSARPGTEPSGISCRVRSWSSPAGSACRCDNDLPS